MNWINIECTTLDSEEFLGAEPIERATWLCLLRYCVGQENGGRITGAREWKDRKWQQVVRVTAREITSQCDLWVWDGGDLVISFYPKDKEEEVRRNRENGAKGGRPRKATAEPRPKPAGNHPVPEKETTRFDSAETERNGRERKGSTHPQQEGGREERTPSIEDCEAWACERLPALKPFAASVARQFWGIFDRKDWRTDSAEDLLHRGKWKSRLLQMLEEESRKSGGGRRTSPPAEKQRPGSNLGDSTSLEGL